MWKTLSWLINRGVTDSLPDREVKLIKIVNSLGILSGTLVLWNLPALVPMYPQTKVLIIAIIIDAVGFYSVLVINALRYYLVARLILGFVPLVVISIFSIYLGPHINAHLYFLLIIVAALFIYPKQQLIC